MAIERSNIEQEIPIYVTFFQCQAILARTLIPWKDSPSAKFTVNVKLWIGKSLTALFSEIETKKGIKKTGWYHLSM